MLVQTVIFEYDRSQHTEHGGGVCGGGGTGGWGVWRGWNRGVGCVEGAGGV